MIVNGFEPSTDRFGDRLMTTLLIDWWHLCWQIWWFIWSCNYFPKPYFAFARKRFSNIAQTWLICIISIFKAVEDIQDTLSKPRYILVCLPTAPPLRAADQIPSAKGPRGTGRPRDQQIKGPGQATAAKEKGKRRDGNQGSIRETRYQPLIWPRNSEHTIFRQPYFTFARAYFSNDSCGPITQQRGKRAMGEGSGTFALRLWTNHSTNGGTGKGEWCCTHLRGGCGPITQQRGGTGKGEGCCAYLTG